MSWAHMKRCGLELANQMRAPLLDEDEIVHRAGALFDSVHEAFHKRHAELIRCALPYPAIRARLYSAGWASPYR